MSEKYTPGERVRVTIEGPVTQEALGSLYVDVGDGILTEVPMEALRVTVERVAPAEWPPRPGDKWRDRHGSAWFAFYGLEAREVFMIPADPVSGPLRTPTPENVLDRVGPLTLVHRDDEQDGAEPSEPAEQSAYGLDLARAVREDGGRS